MRSIWNGAVSFGLVNIPVKLYPATEDRSVSFRLLHDRCHTPLRYARFCPTCEREVEAGEIVRGYEYARGQFVLLSEEELAALAPPSSRAIELSEFVDLAAIDPLYFERSYYLAPGEGGHKAYHLLRQAMAEERQVGLAKITLHSRETLAALRVYGQVLLLATLTYPEEIRDPAALPELGPPVEVEEREREMARRLIETLKAPFEPQKYHDQYRAAVEKLIASKVSGREMEIVPAPAPAKVVDLMEALQASIERTEKKAGSTAASPPRRTGTG